MKRWYFDAAWEMVKQGRHTLCQLFHISILTAEVLSLSEARFFTFDAFIPLTKNLRGATLLASSVGGLGYMAALLKA